MMLIRNCYHDMLLDISKVRCIAEVHHSITSWREEEDELRKAKLENNCTLFDPAEVSGMGVLVLDEYQQRL